ncbi:hypothetical protein FKW77_009660 [Venturia effusa]|uniref:OTU domain-containing protein n=1 Tax=Venturia effusa TaxID=50376 RepID=A0A517L655_9PEZI|nr:hypothetical protein FKW77_009660 [Venturia effusa]
MDEIQSRHRKEQRDLQSVITQKKKSASKKTRKGVNDECARLEVELKARQEGELAALNGDGDGDGEGESSTVQEDQDEPANAESSDQPPNSAIENPSLTSPPSHPSSQSAQQPATAPKKRNRQKERLARRAAALAESTTLAEEEANQTPDLRALERERMGKAFTERGLVEREVRADGHCLYASVADQLGVLGVRLVPRVGLGVGDGDEDGVGAVGGGRGEGEGKLEPYRIVRKTAAQYIKEHEEDFEAFLEEPVDEYVRKVGETGEWGGELELLALARAYGVGISVLDGNGQVHEVEGTDGKEEEGRRIWLAYYRHGFGLGEHYNSLRKG